MCVKTSIKTRGVCFNAYYPRNRKRGATLTYLCLRFKSASSAGSFKAYSRRRDNELSRDKLHHTYVKGVHAAKGREGSDGERQEPKEQHDKSTRREERWEQQCERGTCPWLVWRAPLAHVRFEKCYTHRSHTVEAFSHKIDTITQTQTAAAPW